MYVFFAGLQPGLLVLGYGESELAAKMLGLDAKALERVLWTDNFYSGILCNEIELIIFSGVQPFLRTFILFHIWLNEIICRRVQIPIEVS